MSDISRHDREISSNLASWQAKPLLRLVYRDIHQAIARELSPLPGLAVELGSGIGNIQEVIPDCLRTDLFPNPWLDQTENAYALSFADGSVANLILFDVFHHLRYPGTALKELARVLRPGGRILIYEPSMGALGKLVFGVFHHEPIALGDEITWLAPEGWTAADADYYAAQGNASRTFRETQVEMEGLRVESIRHFSQLSYVATGGYSKPQLYPTRAYPLMRRLDALLDRVPALFATRMLVVLSKPLD